MVKFRKTQAIVLLWFDGGGNEWLGFGGVKFDGRWHARAVVPAEFDRGWAH